MSLSLRRSRLSAYFACAHDRLPEAQLLVESVELRLSKARLLLGCRVDAAQTHIAEAIGCASGTLLIPWTQVTQPVPRSEGVSVPPLLARGSHHDLGLGETRVHQRSQETVCYRRIGTCNFLWYIRPSLPICASLEHREVCIIECAEPGPCGCAGMHGWPACLMKPTGWRALL